MTEEHLREIKRIFGQYKQNITQLKQLTLPSIRGVSYDNIAVQTDKSKNVAEQLMITYLIDKERLEKEIALVDRVHAYFADDRDPELASLIDIRFRQGKYHWQAVNETYVSDRQGLRWLEKAYKKAEEIGLQLHIF